MGAVSISNSSNLIEFDINGSNFTGKVNIDFGGLPGLLWLVLASNPLGRGEVDDLDFLNSLTKCRKLQILDLSYDQTFFPNNILEPSSESTKRSQRNLGYLDVTKLKNLGYLDVSENHFSGEIPSGLGSCVSLEHLYIEGKLFERSNPNSFKSLRGLQNLDLSRNKLSGQLPEYLQQFSLMTLNLSFNKFEGAVPTTGVFRNATALSIVENKKLCGGIRN
ncbi:hypothetical protein Golob_000047 [Gossypium lobatum]|uniref:Uncharacterized protein n=2 Tax=Gossypium TaxID=3633 RepID=A0A7J8NI80_9ROSI|nr:hypothetical protein [Gossypium lobatum]